MSRLDKAEELLKQAMHRQPPAHLKTSQERFTWQGDAAIRDLREALFLLIDELRSS